MADIFIFLHIKRQIWESDSKKIVTRWAMCQSRMLPSSYLIKLQLTYMKYNEIQVLIWNRHKYGVGINRLIGFQPSSIDNSNPPLLTTGFLTTKQIKQKISNLLRFIYNSKTHNSIIKKTYRCIQWTEQEMCLALQFW